MKDILNDMAIKKVFDHDTKQSALKYFYLKAIINKLKKYDENRACFGDYNLTYLASITMANYDVYLAMNNISLVGGVFVGSPFECPSIFSISYLVNDKYRNQGVGSELLRRAIKTSFDDCQCSKILISHNVENVPSKKIIQKCSFKFSEKKVILNHLTGNLTDELYYELDRKHYNEIEEQFASVKKLVK